MVIKGNIGALVYGVENDNNFYTVGFAAGW